MRLAVFVALACLACHSRDPAPPAAEAGVRLAIVATNFDSPLALTYAPGDPLQRLFVVEKTGRVRVVRAGLVEHDAFLDLSKDVSAGSEQGLLGLAFHPKWAENRRFYVNYTNAKGDTRVIEYTTRPRAPDQVDLASAREILAVAQPFANHNGGNLAFGPDGLLYVGLGDGGGANDTLGNAQNDASRLGKMLQIDVNTDPPTVKAIAKGLRNPWRYAFDRATGDLYIGDVGQARWESVHVVPAGQLPGLNFGWNVIEGRGHCVTPGCSAEGLRQPVLDYPHSEGCSITGGFVYRGRALPELAGTYFYSDFCTGFLRSFRWKDGAVADAHDWTSALSPGGVPSPSSFGEDEAGELYVVSLAGTVWRFARAGGR